MKYSVSTWVYGNQDIEVTFRILKELGFDAIELKGEPDAYSVSELKGLSIKYGIEIISIAGIFPWPTMERDLSSPDFSVRSKAINYLKKCCLFAKDVGASIIIVSPTPVGKVLPSLPFSNEDEWKAAVAKERDLAVDSLRQVGQYGQETNVYLAIEPINRYETFLINNAQQALDFIFQINSSSIKLHLDTFHMNIEEKSMIEAIKSSRDYLVNIHIADSNREAVGRGHIDFNGIINVLNDVGYNGPLTLEILPAVSNPYVVAKYESFRSTFNNYLMESIQRLKNFSHRRLG